MHVQIALFVVIAGGSRGAKIASLAEAQAAYDTRNRHVLRAADAVELPPLPDGTEAVVVDSAGCVRAILNVWQVMTPAWIEDSFLRAQRPHRHEFRTRFGEVADTIAIKADVNC